MAPRILGIDIGGTNIDAGIVDERGAVLAICQSPTRPSEGPEQSIARSAESILTMIAKSGIAREQIAGVGIGSAGPLDLKAGCMVHPPNFPKSWWGYGLRDDFADRLGFDPALDNDANAAALAEGWAGSAKGCKDYVVLTLGTGVGGGAVANGQILRGPDGCAGELGHVCIYPDGKPCGCGGYGCLEAYASATAVANRAKELFPSMPEPGRDWSARDVFELAASGNQMASAIVAEAGKALGVAIGTLLNTFNPEMVVLAGRMALSFPLLQPHIEAHARRHSYPTTFGRAAIRQSPLGDRAGIIGAAAVFAYERNIM